MQRFVSEQFGKTYLHVALVGERLLFPFSVSVDTEAKVGTHPWAYIRKSCFKNALLVSLSKEKNINSRSDST